MRSDRNRQHQQHRPSHRSLVGGCNKNTPTGGGAGQPARSMLTPSSPPPDYAIPPLHSNPRGTRRKLHLTARLPFSAPVGEASFRVSHRTTFAQLRCSAHDLSSLLLPVLCAGGVGAGVDHGITLQVLDSNPDSVLLVGCENLTGWRVGGSLWGSDLDFRACLAGDVGFPRNFRHVTNDAILPRERTASLIRKNISFGYVWRSACLLLLSATKYIHHKVLVSPFCFLHSSSSSSAVVLCVSIFHGWKAGEVRKRYRWRGQRRCK